MANIFVAQLKLVKTTFSNKFPNNVDPGAELLHDSMSTYMYRFVQTLGNDDKIRKQSFYKENREKGIRRKILMVYMKHIHKSQRGELMLKEKG